MIYLTNMLLKGPQNPARIARETNTETIALYGFKKCQMKEDSVLGSEWFIIRSIHRYVKSSRKYTIDTHFVREVSKLSPLFLLNLSPAAGT